MAEKIAVIVGVGAGMGMALARRFGREGFRLGLLARRQEALAGYVAELAEENIQAGAFPVHLNDLGALSVMFTRIRETLGHPQILIYNAAMIESLRPSSLPAETLIDHFRVNVAGALVAAQEVIPQMREAGEGTILLTGGGLALRPSPDYASLAIGKAGLRSLSYSLAMELESQGIHVATVTIAGGIQAGTPFDPERIAEVFWRLHAQPREAWEREIVFDRAYAEK